MGGTKVFAEKGKASFLERVDTEGLIRLRPDVPDLRNLMQTKKDSLARFIHIIRPLQDVYTLPPTSLHIFYDREGELIAFNRNASLFLNLRYFEQWRKSICYPGLSPCLHDLTDDVEVQSGQLTNAYISWWGSLPDKPK